MHELLHLVLFDIWVGLQYFHLCYTFALFLVQTSRVVKPLPPPISLHCIKQATCMASSVFAAFNVSCLMVWHTTILFKAKTSNTSR